MDYLRHWVICPFISRNFLIPLGDCCHYGAIFINITNTTHHEFYYQWFSKVCSQSMGSCGNNHMRWHNPLTKWSICFCPVKQWLDKYVLVLDWRICQDSKLHYSSGIAVKRQVSLGTDSIYGLRTDLYWITGYFYLLLGCYYSKIKAPLLFTKNLSVSNIESMGHVFNRFS